MLGNILTPTSLLWTLRQVLQFGGIWLAMSGHATTDDVAQVLGIFDQVLQPTGAVMFLIGFVGNVYSSFRTKATVDGQAIGVGAIAKSVGQGSATEVVQVARAAIERKPTLWESWFGRR